MLPKSHDVVAELRNAVAFWGSPDPNRPLAYFSLRGCQGFKIQSPPGPTAGDDRFLWTRKCDEAFQKQGARCRPDVGDGLLPHAGTGACRTAARDPGRHDHGATHG